MKTVARQAVGLFVLCFVLGICTPAHAGTATSTLNVQATLGGACTVSANALDFGSLVANPTANIDTASSTITVNCSNGLPYSVDLGAGTNPRIGTQFRNLTNAAAPGNLVGYFILSDPARTLVWGTSVAGGAVSGTGNGTNQSLGVFGRIPAGAITTQLAGTYTDSVSVTVTF